MAKKMKQVSPEEIAEVKATALRMVADNADLVRMYERYRQIYFLENVEQMNAAGVDARDWKITASPSGRNAVTGMKRLMDTSEIHINIKSDGDKHSKSDDIEEGLKKILSVSGEYRRARIEKDAVLSAILYGPVVLGSESVADMLAVHKTPVYRKRIEAIQKRTPMLIRAINAEQSFQDWGELGMFQHLRKYQMTAAQLMEKWGIPATGDARKLTNVWDFIDVEKRVVWADGVKDTIFAKYHGMENMNIVARYAGGTSLFSEAKYQLQPFLYAHAKGEWDKRENLWWTYVFTSIYRQGIPGPLFVIDPDALGPNGEVEVRFANGVRALIAKPDAAKLAEYRVIDNDLMQLKSMLDEVDNESMIYKQTLGQNIAGATFSGLSMLSSAGQLPLQDPKEAIQQAFKDIFEHILCRIKYEGIDNELISPLDIPDEYEIEVKLEPKLPQDNLRNSQIAQGLGDLVSDEWKHENLLQIGDTKAMMKQVIREQMLKAFSMKLMQDPQVMGQFIQMALGNLGGNQPTQPTAISSQPSAPPEEQSTPQQGQPDMMAQGQQPPDMMAQPGAEQMPKSGPMVPPQERV